jgi:hypothetical protein
MRDAPPASVLRKDPDRRTTRGLARGFPLLAVAASLAPALVVALALWPTTVPDANRSPRALTPGIAVDFAAVRAAIKARDARAPSPSRAEPRTPLALEPARLEGPRALLKRVFRARDARRAAGAMRADLRKPFTVAELGGAAALTEAGVEAGARLLISRPDGVVVAPAGARAPEGVDLSSRERDEDVLEADATLEGRPVRVLRRCLAGELLCLVDIVPRPAPALASAMGADAALLALLDSEERRVRAPTFATAPSPSPAGRRTTLSAWAGVGGGGILALVLGGALALRLARTGSHVAAAAARIRALAAGRAGRAPVDIPHELAALHAAIDEHASALGDAREQADVDDARRRRMAELGMALKRAQDRSAERVSAHADDDAATMAIVDAVNALLESVEARVVRWKSHADAALAPAAHSRVEGRAQAIAGVPALLTNVAQRLQRLARFPGLSPQVLEELNTLADGLARRGRAAQTLVDQLLKEAAADRRGDEASAALSSLHHELSALSPSVPVHTTVAALRDLPVAELASRVAKP